MVFLVNIPLNVSRSYKIVIYIVLTFYMQKKFLIEFKSKIDLLSLVNCRHVDYNIMTSK